MNTLAPNGTTAFNKCGSDTYDPPRSWTLSQTPEIK